MKLILAAACIGLCLVGAPAEAARSAPTTASEDGSEAVIRLRPPLGKKLRYRSLITEEEEGKVSVERTIEQIQFDEISGGFRLTITPAEFQYDDPDPMMADFYRRLEALMRRPAVLLLAADGSVTGMEDDEVYWAELFEAGDAFAADSSDTALSPNFKAALAIMMVGLRGASAEERLSLVATAYRPLLEFASGRWKKGDTGSKRMKVFSPAGGILNQDAKVTLEEVDDGLVTFTYQATIPDRDQEIARTSFLGIMARGLAGTAEGSPGAGLNLAVDELRHDSTGSSKVRLADGLLVSHRSTTTSEYSMDGQRSKSVETTIIELIE